MKKISWITAESFLDVDLPVISKLKNSYKIFWQIIINNDSSKDYVNQLIPEFGENLIVKYVYERYRRRDPRLFFITYKILKTAKLCVPNLYYIDGFMLPWGPLLMRLLLPKKTVVVACHNVTTPKGGSLQVISKIAMNFVLHKFNNIHVFSKGQKEKLEEKYPSKNILLAPLALKDYGAPSVSLEREDLNYVRFLYFGIIREYKRVDLLIDAACQLYDRGYNNFKVLIAGSCDNWPTRYAPKIAYPEIFEVDIRRIPNDEVANLFARSDYFVMPYQDIAQSGAITVAFQYNVPTIVSNIPQFHEFVDDGKTGLMFKSEDATALADKMQYVIDNHSRIHKTLKQNQADFVRHNLSLDSIVEKYINYFDRF